MDRVNGRKSSDFLKSVKTKFYFTRKLAFYNFIKIFVFGWLDKLVAEFMLHKFIWVYFNQSDFD